MAKKQRHLAKPAAQAAAKPAQSLGVPVQPIQVATAHYQGPIPPPSILEGFDRIVPGAAQRLIQLAEDESKHRRELEVRTMEANIAAQRRQLDIGEYQSKAVFRSDFVAQLLGASITVFCVLAAIWASMHDQVAIAVILAGIPTAAVIQAFFKKQFADKK
jgi:uncharacterized membrane protein